MRLIIRSLAALLATGLAGCGSAGSNGPPRAVVRATLRALADGETSSVCAAITQPAVAELQWDFGGKTCEAAVNGAERFIRSQEGEVQAIAHAKVLEPTDLPFSPAPTLAGGRQAAVRVVLHDPVLGRQQSIDLEVQRRGGTWMVRSGVAALFTVL